MGHPPDEIFNQPPELGDLNLYAADPVVSNLALQSSDELLRIGAVAGSREFCDWGFQANRFPPELQTFDRFGRRIDQVEFHPSWHQLMATSVGMGITSLPHDETAPDYAHLDRAIRAYLVGQVEQGHMCPVSMTYAVVPALRKQPDVAARWESALASRVYDRSFRPSTEKQGVLMGMGMTERQGGSDVRSNTSIAAADGVGGPGGEYRITGSQVVLFCADERCISRACSSTRRPVVFLASPLDS